MSVRGKYTCSEPRSFVTSRSKYPVMARRQHHVIPFIVKTRFGRKRQIGTAKNEHRVVALIKSHDSNLTQQQVFRAYITHRDKHTHRSQAALSYSLVYITQPQETAQ